MKKTMRTIHSHFSELLQLSRGGTTLLIVVSMVANVVNFLYNAYLGRSIGFSEFGLVTLIGSFINIAQIPLMSYSRSIVHRSGYLFGKYKQPAVGYWEEMRKKSWTPALILTIGWILATPLLAFYFHSAQLLPFLIFTPVWTIGVTAAVNSGFLSGSHKFTAIAVMTLVEVVVKFFSTVLIVQAGFSSFVYLALPLSAMSSFLVGWLYCRQVVRGVVKTPHDYEKGISKKFFISSILTRISATAILSFDVLLTKHYLSPVEAGKYALLSLVGSIVYFLGSLFSQFVVPMVSKDEGAGRSSEKTLFILLFLLSVVESIGFVGIGIFGYITVPILFGTQKAMSIVPFLPWYVGAMSIYAFGTAMVSYDQVKNKHLVSLVSTIAAFGTVFGIMFFHGSIGQITTVVFINSLAFITMVVLLHFFDKELIPIIRNVVDFFGLFSGKYKELDSKESLSILIYSWRDTKHVWAGGSETYIHELAKRWVAQGHRVTVFCGNDQNNPRNEVIDGVQMVRRGGFYTVYIWACLYYLLRFQGNFDLVIDTENGIPFFTPLYVRVPTFLLIHHVHQEVLRKHLAFPLSHIGMFLESQAMPKIYQKNQVVTISDSSREDIVKLGFAEKSRIHIVNPGIDVSQYKSSQKTLHPSLLYLGRLKHYKHVDLAIMAIERLRNNFPTIVLTIAGEGDDFSKLKKLVKELGVEQWVKFVGKVTEEEKISLLGTSWVMVQPSLIEGWGMTVIEANACKTTVVASNVNGLKDSVQNGETGILFESNNLNDLVLSITKILGNKQYRDRLSTTGFAYSQKFDWNNCAEGFLHIILNNFSSSNSPFAKMNKSYISSSQDL